MQPPSPRDATTVRYKFSRRQRLRKRRDFARVFANKCTAGNGRIVIYLQANHTSVSRLGIVTGRKVGKAVARNRIKRLIREAFRQSQHALPTGLDIICVVKPQSPPSLSECRASLVRLVTNAHQKLRRRARAGSVSSAARPYEES